ncbi:YtfJ family protein [Vibrio sinaloensis]|uniref:YtfJ family protein n=1 Tax=Photobacterium sp. (strain ATCC 43367) TaxID=379097 RepID=UPI00205953F5|nr:YtfJ family protein [Vibrio sinaloensis]UPQ88267.1 YtfJ family protein [Vibrio sinaloensis]
MKIKTLLTLLVACSPSFAFAHNITLGQSVPSVEVTAYGEVTLDGDKTSFQAWSSNDLLGKVRVIQAIAGRSSAKEMNAALMNAITEAKFSTESYQTTTIINQDDAVWGTGSFVKSSAQDSKKEFPWSSIVLDEEGSVAKAWQLAEESSAIIVQDKQGQVLFVKEGALNQQQIEQVLTLIKQHL